jgi:hypothetical protein
MAPCRVVLRHLQLGRLLPFSVSSISGLVLPLRYVASVIGLKRLYSSSNALSVAKQNYWLVIYRTLGPLSKF